MFSIYLQGVVMKERLMTETKVTEYGYELREGWSVINLSVDFVRWRWRDVFVLGVVLPEIPISGECRVFTLLVFDPSGHFICHFGHPGPFENTTIRFNGGIGGGFGIHIR